MKNYRVYETFRNNGGGLDSCGTDWEYIEAESAQDAADQAAQEREGVKGCEGLTIVATDDDGESATADVPEAVRPGAKEEKVMSENELVQIRLTELLAQTTMSSEECLAAALDDVLGGWTPDAEE